MKLLVRLFLLVVAPLIMAGATASRVQAAPSISSVNPNPVPTSNSTQTFTINGSGFTSSATVTLRNPFQTYPNQPTTSITSNQIVMPVNLGTTASQWSVEVIVNGVSSGQFNFQVSAVVPAISSYSWSTTPTANQNFNGTITGTGFTAGIRVFFCVNGTSTCYEHPAAGIAVNGSTSLSLSNVNLGGGTYQIYVQTSAGQSARSTAFTVQVTPVVPTITGYSWSTIPTSSQNFGGSISGTGFISGIRVFFCVNGTSTCYEHPQAGITLNSSTSLSLINVNLSGGSWQFYVQTSGGQSSRSAAFAVQVGAPTISSISPDPVAVGKVTTLTVSGSNFQNNFAASVTGPAGTFNIATTGLAFVSSNQVRVQVTMGSTPPYPATLRITNPDTQSATKTFQVVSVPDTNPAFVVSPGSGPIGTEFTHNGTNCTPNSTVTIYIVQGNGSVIGPFKYNTDSAGSFSFRYTSKTGDPLGTYNYDVSDDSTGKLVKAQVQYIAGPPPATDILDRNTHPIDITIGDYSEFAPGQQESKIWKIRNGGSNAWSNYKLVFLSGTINGHPSTNLSDRSFVTINASPGETFQTPSIPIIAPNTESTYYSYWGMRNAQGQNFGDPIWAIIRVVKGKTTKAGLGSQTTRGGTKDSPHSNSGSGADPVNTATGNFNYEQTDVSVPGRGMGFDFSRTYNSQDNRRGPLGNGWTHSFNIYLDNISATSATINYSDSKAIDYDQDSASGNFRPRYSGFHDVLVRNADNSWTLQKTDQRIYQFNSSGRLISISDSNQNRLSLGYDDNGNLSNVVDTAGRMFNFNYSGALLSSVTDPIGRTLQFTYDGNSNLTSFRNANGNLNSYEYDGSLRLTRIVDGRSNTFLTNSYDAAGRVISQTTARGNTYQLSYDFDKGLTTVTDPNLKSTVHLHDENFNLQATSNSLNLSNVILYDARGNRQQVSDAKGNYFSFSYGDNGNVESLTDPLLNSRQVSYDARNNPLSLTNELGKQTGMIYDERGNLTQLTDALGNAATTTYNSFGQPLVTTDARGNTTTRTYDAQGNLASVKDALNNTTTYTYDAVGRRTGMTDARGKTTTYTYDGNNNLLTVTDPSGNVTTYTYDANNNRTTMRDARSNTTRYEYDAGNLLVKETDPSGNFIQYTYDKLDRRTAVRDKRGNVTAFGYDSEGRLTSVTDPLGQTNTYSYDANGNRTEIKDAKGQSALFTYDVMNRVTKIQDPLGNTISKQYDKSGQLVKEIDPRGNVTQFAYDDIGNLSQVTDAASGTAKYAYDKNRNRISQADPNAKISLIAYDKLNRLISSQDPLNNTYTYTYDEVGNRASQTDAKGQTITFAYDASNRLTTVTYPNSSTVRFSYDANGNVLQMVDALGTTGYAYDQLNRVTSYTDAFGKTISYQYDPSGNVTVLTYPDGKQVTYQYDSANRLSAVTDWANRATSYQYDNTNLVTKVLYPNGTTTTYTYDNVGRLTGKTNDPSISAYSFILDANGNRTGASIRQPLATQLENLSQSSTYDSANRIQTAGATTFTFDANGNMTGKMANGATTVYTYDFNDRLIAVGSTSQYFYNGAGTRLQKVEGSATTRYVVDVNRDLSQVLCETDASGNITGYYVYGLGLISKVGADGKHFYYHFDATGSTVAMTDDAKTIINAYAYDPFGRITNSVENTPNSFKFVGQYGVLEDKSGLIYMRARYYDSQTGRFLTRDPMQDVISDSQALNTFIYGGNNPLTRIDPKGLTWKGALQFTGYFLDSIPGAAACIAGFDSSCNPNQSKFMDGVQLVGQVSFDFLLDWGTGGSSEAVKAAKVVAKLLDMVTLVNKYAPLAPKIANGTLTQNEARKAIGDGVSDAIDQALPKEFNFVGKEVNKILTPHIVDYILSTLMSSVGMKTSNSIQIRGPQANPVGKPVSH